MELLNFYCEWLDWAESGDSTDHEVFSGHPGFARIYSTAKEAKKDAASDECVIFGEWEE